MQRALFAVVAYLEGDVARFMAEFRAAASPDEHALRPHLTLLAPRVLEIRHDDAVAEFRNQSFFRIAAKAGEVSSFGPASPTVFLEVKEGGPLVTALNRQLDSGAFAGKPDWPYVPHLTLAKLADLSSVARVLQAAQSRWRDYQGSRLFSLTELTLVRESSPGAWLDLSTIHAAD